MNIHAEGGKIRGRKISGVDLLSARLNRSIGPKQTGEMQHRHAIRFADKVTCLIDSDVVRGRAVTVHDENPLKAVLCDLCAKIGHE